MQIISRTAAIAAGLTHYFTGKPCHRGHIDARFVVSFACLTCNRDNARDAYRAMDDESRSLHYKTRKARVDEWHRAHREQVARIRAEWNQRSGFYKHWYATNKERRKQESRAWYRDNAEYAIARQKAYVAKRRETQLEHLRALGRKSTSRRRAIAQDAFIEHVDPRVVFTRDNGMCGICRTRVEPGSTWEIDHVIPISKGGAHCYANVQLTHRRCNRQKAATLPKGQPTLFQTAPK